MEKPTDIDVKYQKLAAEYSKVRSQATVLKKALLEEQTKNLEIKELMREQEQKLRKHTHEMESLTFRNEQLAKRITVLQQELQENTHGKKAKNKNPENNVHSNFGVLDEELHKKILENAQLLSTMADRELEINNYKEKVEWLENNITQLEKQLTQNEAYYKEEIKKLTSQKLQEKSDAVHKEKNNSSGNENIEDKCTFCMHLKQEVERWKTESEMYKARPKNCEELCEYYESQIQSVLEARQLAQSESNSLWTENAALSARLENLVLEKTKFETNLEKCNEELQTTSKNYKAQLDAMTEHFAAQNEKITKQCDEIQMLKHKLMQKK